MSPTWPLEVFNKMTLSENDGRMTMTIHARSINTTDEERIIFEPGHGSMKQGYSGTLDQRAEYLAKA